MREIKEGEEMSDIEKALKEEQQDFYISNEERISLIEILACVASVLRTGNLYFNGKGDHNLCYADLCIELAKRFANMPINDEH